ncbi:MAG TPA: hypothetical protein PLH88_03305 [Spirochaetota bacterium]|nr:hypothetical protein [Spirochaetota bacterium]
MKKLLVGSLVGFLFLFGCGGAGKYGDIKAFINDVIKTQEEFLTSIEKANSADEMVVTINTFSEKILKLAQQSNEIKKRYPDFEKWDKEPPAELKADIERLDAQAEKFGQIFLSEKIQKFYGDPKVQKALLDMSKKMEDEKFFK